MKLFPELPQDLTKLTPEELTDLAAQIKARIKEVGTRSPDVIGDATMKEVLEQSTAALASLESVNGELAARVAAETEFEAELKKITDAAGVEEEKVEEPKAEAEEPAPEEPPTEEKVETPAPVEAVVVEEPVVEVVEEPVLVTASSQPAARKPLPMPKAEATPVVTNQRGEVALIASAGIPGIGEATELDPISLADAMVRKMYQGSSMPEGYQEKVLVASASWKEMYPEERQLRGDSRDTGKIQDVVGDDALVAAGGLCAPVTNYYELMNISVADRPVRDALASFAAIRGGLRFAAPPTIASVTGVGIKTAAQDALGGTFATKTCQVVACPSFSEKDLSMIYHCIQFGNLGSRAWPEQVAQFNELVLAAHARLAEQALLDGIAAASTAVTSAQIYGAYSSIVNDLLFAAAGLRSRNRMRVDSKMRVLLPEWVGDMIAADLTNRAFSDFQYTRSNVAALLAKQDLLITWYMDTATGAGQVFGTQSAGAILRFPTTVKAYIFPEGSFLFLDGGTLDLGIVRDSTLNASNNFQIFGETFENIAFVGPESLALTATVCPDGTTGPTATAITCS